METLDLKSVHVRLSKCEKFRRVSAKIVKIALIFGVPVILSVVMVFVTGMIYIVRPYFHAEDFIRTTCKVADYSIDSDGKFGCSDRTDPFHPCLKVRVIYGISNATSYQESIIMENEQALISCDRCSYTFGKHGLLHGNQDACESWQDVYDPMKCIDNFIMKNANKGFVFPCFYNPTQPSNVVKHLVVDSNAVIHAISWPILFCMVYFLGMAFVCYDIKQVKLMNKCIRSELAKRRKLQVQGKKLVRERTKSQLGRSLGVYQCELNPISPHDMATSCMKRSESIPVALDNCLPTCKEIDKDEIICADLQNLDLRHLDLAVSSRNIEDLAAAAYSPEETPGCSVYPTRSGSANNSVSEESCASSWLEASCQSVMPTDILEDDNIDRCYVTNAPSRISELFCDYEEYTV